MPDSVIPEDYTAQVAARVALEAELLPTPEATPVPSLITPDLIRQCLANNEAGDGILYTALHRERFVFVKKSQEWLRWCVHHWDQDVLDEHIRGALDVAQTYLDECKKLDIPLGALQEELDEVRSALKEANKLVADANKRAKKAAAAGDDTALEAVHPSGLAAESEAVRLEERQTAIKDQIALLKTEQKAFHRRIDRLRSLAGANHCADWSHIVENPLAITGDEIDQHPMLLACNNGVIDLRTGELHPGSPSDWLVKASPIDYLGFDTPCPTWDAFLDSIQPDEEVKEFLSPLLGYGITGLSVEQFIAVFIGPGRNGKGIMFEMIEQILGPLYWAIQSELLLDNKNARSSAGASPDIVALRGRRVAAASETDEGRRISAARIKELTGSDTLNARLLYDKRDTNFRPTHKLFLRSQHIPVGLTKDFALRERLIFIRFPYMFVDDPAAKAIEDPANAEMYRLKDRGLKAKLMLELPGILAWFVRGCAKWLADGRLMPPASLQKAVEELHLAEDYTGRFLSDCCEPGSDIDYEVYSHLYRAFEAWYKEEECIEDESPGTKYIPTSKSFAKDLKEKGYRSPDKKTTGGTKRVHGLRLLGHSSYSLK